MAGLTREEARFLDSNEVCRLATASKDGRPQVTPVIYVLDGGYVIIATDYGTKKLKNLRENPRVSLVVDEYSPSRAVVVEGTCEIHEQGVEYRRLLGRLFERFESYRKNPWKEGESPILKIAPTKVVSWGV